MFGLNPSAVSQSQAAAAAAKNRKVEEREAKKRLADGQSQAQTPSLAIEGACAKGTQSQIKSQAGTAAVPGQAEKVQELCYTLRNGLYDAGRITFLGF